MLLASRHSFLLEDTKVVFNGCWPHAYSPAPWNVPCLGHSPSHQGSDCGEGKSQLSRPWPELSLKKEGICFNLGLPTQSPTPLPEPSCLQKKAHCSSLQLLLLWEYSTPNVEIRDRVYKKL